MTGVYRRVRAVRGQLTHYASAWFVLAAGLVLLNGVVDSLALVFAYVVVLFAAIVFFLDRHDVRGCRRCRDLGDRALRYGRRRRVALIGGFLENRRVLWGVLAVPVVLAVGVTVMVLAHRPWGAALFSAAAWALYAAVVYVDRTATAERVLGPRAWRS